MAIKWINAAFETEGVPPMVRLALLCIADHANDAGEAWPGLTRIASRTGMSRSTVIRCIARLEAMKIVIAQRAEGFSTRYTLAPIEQWNPCQPDTRVRVEPVSEWNPPGVTVERVPVSEWNGGGVTVTPEPSITVIEPPEKSCLSGASEIEASKTIELPTSNCKTWSPSVELMNALKDAHPNINVEGELAKAKAWLVANPDRRKTAKGMGRFVTNWLSRCSENARQHPRRESKADRNRRESEEWGGLPDEALPF